MAVIYSTTDSVESPLDVVVHFTGPDWKKARQDPDWAVSKVVLELKKYKSQPEEYFSIKPAWVARCLSWEKRMQIDVKGHIWILDRHMRFSQWWIVKIMRRPQPRELIRDILSRFTEE
jgi:hypothetical protein